MKDDGGIMHGVGVLDEKLKAFGIAIPMGYTSEA